MDLKAEFEKWEGKWKSDWEKSRDRIEIELKENRERVMKMEEIEGLEDLIDAGAKGNYNKAVREKGNEEKYREFIKRVENLNEEDLINQQGKIVDEFRQFKKEIKHAGRHVLSTICCLLKPEIFIFGGHAIDAGIKTLMKKEELHTPDMVEFISEWITQIPREKRIEGLYYLSRFGREKWEEKESKTNKKVHSIPVSLSSILTALETKPFLILAGISGTGKTQIARIIAGVMSSFEKEEKAQPLPPNPPFDKGGERGDHEE
uniref:Uncharacterized protein n=1 Tax=uncultured prokaryote TaxID=198431 RepID=H5SPZ1_9ZZZZ|nr:hypothetical protein HGMM_F55D02C27 [uncultured prokaryote]